MQEYDVEISGSRAALAAVLSDVADGLRAGSVTLGEDEDAVTVDLPSTLDMEIELETADGVHSIELELEWPAADGTETTTVDAEASGPESADADGSDHAGAADSDASGSPADPSGVSEGSAAADTAVESDAPASEVVAVPGGRRSLARFEIFQDRASEWRWRLRHRNGNIIATSGEGYTQKHNAWKGLRSVVANAPEAEINDESS